jgi:hypothetical protein
MIGPARYTRNSTAGTVKVWRQLEGQAVSCLKTVFVRSVEVKRCSALRRKPKLRVPTSAVLQC